MGTIEEISDDKVTQCMIFRGEPMTEEEITDCINKLMGEDNIPSYVLY